MGFVKGVIGMDIPTISIALRSTAVDLLAALQIIVVPTVVTNAWQALIGDGMARLARPMRLAPDRHMRGRCSPRKPKCRRRPHSDAPYFVDVHPRQVIVQHWPTSPLN